MFGFGRGRKNKECRKRERRYGADNQHGLGCGHHGNSRCINLDEAAVGQRYRVIANPDKKTMEMGIYHTGVITVHKNEESNPNIVVGVGESRYIIPRDLAKRIVIK
jgi:Fe2+ transport system protein FeoA